MPAVFSTSHLAAIENSSALFKLVHTGQAKYSYVASFSFFGYSLIDILDSLTLSPRLFVLAAQSLK